MSDVDRCAALSASVAGSGRKPPILVTDVDEIDEMSASLAENGLPAGKVPAAK